MPPRLLVFVLCALLAAALLAAPARALLAPVLGALDTVRGTGA